MNFSALRAKKLLFTSLLLLIWACTALIVNPIGDFPLNDDFSFGRTVFNLSERGIPEFDDWLSMTLLTQVLWGAGFSELFGFSFTALRISTLIAGLMGAIALLFLIGRSKAAFFSVLVLAFNPLYFSLSYTFMSDVPFLACLILTALFFSKALQTGAKQWIIAGTLAGIAATLVRQLGLMAPLAFGLVWIFQKRRNLPSVLTAIAPLMITGLIYWLYLQWFEHTQGLPDTFGTIPKLFKRISQDDFWWTCWQRTGILLIYLGFFLLPVNLVYCRRPRGKGQWLALLILSIIALAAMWSIWDRTPWGNVLYNLGLGPKTLKDGIYFINVSPTLSANVLNLLRMIACAGALLLVANLVVVFFTKMKREYIRNGKHPFFLVCAIIYTGFLMLDVYFFDRYFLPLIFFVMVLLVFQPPPGPVFSRKGSLRKFAGLISLVAISFFSVTATHDYLSWNRARWQALDHLTEDRNIAPNSIDGGFEFNGWHRPGPLEYGKAKSWWWVDRDDYAVTFGDLPGYHREKPFPYVRYLPPGCDTIFILKKH